MGLWLPGTLICPEFITPPTTVPVPATLYKSCTRSSNAQLTTSSRCGAGFGNRLNHFRNSSMFSPVTLDIKNKGTIWLIVTRFPLPLDVQRNGRTNVVLALNDYRHLRNAR